MDETPVSHLPFDRVKEVVDRTTGEVLSRTQLDGNTNFVMFFRDKMPIFTKLVREHPTAASVLITMIGNMDHGNMLQASQRTLSALSGVSLATINRAIAQLVESKLIETFKCGAGTAYAINANLVWTTHSDGRKYARCKADLILAQDEQPPIQRMRVKSITVRGIPQVPGQQTLFHR